MDLQKQKILRRGCQEYTEDLYEKDNHDDVITHLEPDILECEVKQALESTDVKNANGGDLMLMEVV